jgi:drug/metabolite transporter (DMT)-like permease
MILMAVASGSCFGLIFVLLSHTSDDAGMWPLLGMRLSSIPTVLIVALVARKSLAVPRSALAITIASGVLDTLSNGLYLLATRHGMLIIVAVVTALYPVSTVLLATSLDEERVSRSHLVGMVGAGVALVLVSLARA